ncbi:hypothetical protein [Streptomyces sp. P9-A2]|uniref:hypothetical protein n=1 Tax=Streptomyces sp. P9-A2 TaxID=3072284 RepID=UPI002FCBEEE6
MRHPDFELYDNAGRGADQIAAAHFGIATRDDLLRWARGDAEPFLAQHGDNQPETAARPHAWRYGRALRSAFHRRVPTHG